MRAAIIKSNYNPYGGAEKYTARMIRAFERKGVSVDVLTSGSAHWPPVSERVRIVPLKRFRYNNFLRAFTFNRSVRRHMDCENYDFSLAMDRTDSQTYIRAGGGCHAAWLDRRCKEVSWARCMSFRINPFHRYMLSLERKAFCAPLVQRIFCNSELVKNEIMERYPLSPERLIVVHNGVEWNEFADAFKESEERRTGIRRNLGLEESVFLFLYVGSGYERKGLGKAISALAFLPEETGLIVVGKDRNEAYYRRLAQRAGVGGRVHFFGPRKDSLPFLQAADAFVLPTLYDAFSNACLEALAMGLFTVTSSSNGCAEVIKEGAGSIIDQLDDIDSVAESMKTALSVHFPRVAIRESVKHLEFENQLGRIVDICIQDALERRGKDLRGHENTAR